MTLVNTVVRKGHGQSTVPVPQSATKSGRPILLVMLRGGLCSLNCHLRFQVKIRMVRLGIVSGLFDRRCSSRVSRVASIPSHYPSPRRRQRSRLHRAGCFLVNPFSSRSKIDSCLRIVAVLIVKRDNGLLHGVKQKERLKSGRDGVVSISQYLPARLKYTYTAKLRFLSPHFLSSGDMPLLLAEDMQN